MVRYTLQQRIAIIKIHYENGENFAVTVRKTKAFLGRREAPCRTAIQKLVEKFELLGQVSDVKNKTRTRRSRTIENIAAVAQSVEENPGLSIPRRSLELGIPQTSLHRILHKDLGIMEAHEINVKFLTDFQEPFTVEYGCAETRLGEIQLCILNGAVCMLYFDKPLQLKENIEILTKRLPNANFIENTASIKVKADEIFSHEKRKVDVLLLGTEFQNVVWQTLLRIPQGETWTYSDCANAIGKPSAVRAVAKAVANNEIAYLIPCHRIVSKSGNKFKYRWGAHYKKKLLECEENLVT